MSDEADEAGAADVAALVADLGVLVGRLKRRLREQALPGDLSWSQISVLGQLDREGPATVTALARAEGVRPQSMGATVAALEQAGLVVGAPHPTDGRQTLFALTDTCREWIRARRAARADWLAQAIQTTFSPAEQAELVRAVELLKRLAEA